MQGSICTLPRLLNHTVAPYLPSCWGLFYHIASGAQPANLKPWSLLSCFGRSLPPRSCSHPWKHLPICHSALSAGQLCWVILASSFLPTTSEPMHKAIAKIQSQWGLPVQPWALSLGAPVEATAHIWSPITAQCQTQGALSSHVGSTMQANGSR